MVKIPDDGKPITLHNRRDLDADIGGLKKDSPYYPFLAVLCDILDSAGSGADSFVSVGTTRNKSALTILVQLGGKRVNLYAPDLRALASECRTLL